MTCHRLDPHGRPANFWHRMRCAECRAAHAADTRLKHEITGMRTLPSSEADLQNTLQAIRALAPPVTRTQKRRMRIVPVFLMGSVVVAAGLSWHWLNLSPEENIPPLVLPVPNGFDRFIAAGNALRDTEQIARAVHTSDLSLAEKSRLIGENRDALAQLRAGLTLECRHPALRMFAPDLSYLEKFRLLAMLLHVEAEVKAAQGDWDGALNAHLDAILFGRKFALKGTLRAWQTGIECVRIGHAGVERILPHLTAQEAKAGERRLVGMPSELLAQALKEEMYAGQAALLDLFQHSNWRGEAPKEPKSWLATLSLLLTSKQQVLDNYTRYMNRISILNPYTSKNRPLVWPDASPLPDDPVSRAMVSFPLVSYWFQELTYLQTADELLHFALGLQAYYREKGNYPAHVGEAGAYFTRFSWDVYTTEPKALTYRRKGSAYLLYSIGPDGVDDGGRPIGGNHPAAVGNPFRQDQITPQSQGDIVFGQNAL